MLEQLKVPEEIDNVVEGQEFYPRIILPWIRFGATQEMVRRQEGERKIVAGSDHERSLPLSSTEKL